MKNLKNNNKEYLSIEEYDSHFSYQTKKTKLNNHFDFSEFIKKFNYLLEVEKLVD